MSAGDYEEVRWNVEPAYAGMRLDRYLCLRLRGVSRTRVQELIRTQVVAPENAKASRVLMSGQQLVIRRPVLVEPSTPTELPVLYQDDDLLIVNKPAGLPVHPSARYRDGTVVGRLRDALGPNYAAPVHRLDRETSGVLLCTRTPIATKKLTEAFRVGLVHKSYLAICQGHSERERFVVDAPLLQGGDIVGLAMKVDPTGAPSQTEFVVKAKFWREMKPYTLLQAMPRTGRQHQIRAHLRHVGLPLVGDKIYGPDEAIYDRFSKHALTAEDHAALLMSRQALHAASIRFEHPTLGKAMTVAASLPFELREFLPPALRDLPVS